MFRLLLFSACSALVYSVDIDKKEVLEEYEKTDTDFANDTRINVSLVIAPYGFKDGDNWNVTSVKRLLKIVRRSNVGPTILRMLHLISKAESYKKFPSLQDNVANYFYYETESAEEEWKPKKPGPLTDGSVIIVSDPVEARLPHSKISINKMREILWNRAKAYRQKTMRTKETTKQMPQTTTIDRSIIHLGAPFSLRITELNDIDFSAGLIWRAPEGKGRADSYVIEYKDVNESDWIKGVEVFNNRGWNKGDALPGDRLTATQYHLFNLNKTHISGATYEFRVAGYNKAGRGEYSNIAYVHKHDGPVNLTITALSDIKFTANIKWEQTEKQIEVTKYAVEYKQTTETTWTKGVEVPGSNLNAEQNQLFKLNRTDDSGVTYEFRVVAINIAGLGNYSDVAVIYKPSFSSDLKLRNFIYSTSSANLTWARPTDDGGSPITGYQIEYRIGNTTKWQRGSEVKGDVNSVIQPVEKINVLYEFRVTAINAAGYGEPSEAFSGDKPSEPLKFKVTKLNEEKGIAELKWEKSIDDGGWKITKYQVEYRMRHTDTWELGTAVPASDTKATQGGLELTSHEYEFRVRAVNVAGMSDPSNKDHIHTPTEILKLELVDISPETNTVHLKWSNPKEEITPDIIGYIIEFKTKEETEWTTGPKLNGKGTVEIFLNSNEWIQFQKVINMKENTYEFRVRPFNMGGRGHHSNKDFFEKPSPPPSLQVKKLYPESALILWEKPVHPGNGSITGYNIEYKKENETKWKKGLSIDGDVRKAKQNNLQIKYLPQTKYHFRITARNKAGPSKPSDAFTYVPLYRFGTQSKTVKVNGKLGQRITKVIAGGSAESNGLLIGDILLTANGISLDQSGSIVTVRDKARACLMVLKLIRDNKELTIHYLLNVDETIKVANER